MSRYFRKPYEPFGGDINVKVNFFNYATKADIKNISDVDTSSFPLKTNLASLKIGVPVPVDLSKLSDAVKTVYDKLVAKVNSIDTSGFALKTKYVTDKSEIENKIPNTGDPVKKNRLQ